jgi:hypothetical protein
MDYIQIGSGILWAQLFGISGFESILFGFDPVSGKLLFQAGDYNLGYMYMLIRNGYRVYSSNNNLYIGKINGYIDALKLK